MPGRLHSALVATALAALVVCPLAAAGSIVPGVSIDGVRLGQSAAAVRRILGPPPGTQQGPPGSQVVRWDYTAHNSLTVLLDHGRVTSVFVSTIPGRGKVLDRTAKGIGLLSRMSAVAKAYPGHCQPPQPAFKAPPGCSWQTATARMTFQASGRYGSGWNAPVETIQLQLIGRG